MTDFATTAKTVASLTKLTCTVTKDFGEVIFQIGSHHDMEGGEDTCDHVANLIWDAHGFDVCVCGSSSPGGEIIATATA